MADYKKIYDAIYAMVAEMAEEHRFDCDKAVDSIESSGHIQTIVNLMKPADEKSTDTTSDDGKSVDSKTKRSPLEQARHNVQLWTKKLEANKFPDEDKKKKHIEKLEKEQKKLTKLEGPTPKPAPEAVKEPEKVKEDDKPAVAVADKKVKNIPRWGKDKHGADFKKALQENDIEYTEDLEKEFRKLADTMSNDDWKKDGKTYLDHMRAFAKTKTVEAESEEEETSPDVHTLSLDELKAIKMLTPIEQPGQFWDADNGRFVSGPVEEADEDFIETKFNNAMYVVGEKTGRVYKQDEKGDVFAGFIGIGKFKTLKV